MGIYYGGVIVELSFISHTVQFGRSVPACLSSCTEWHISRWYLAVHHHQNTMLTFWTTELECTRTVIITTVNTAQGRNKASSFSCPVIAAYYKTLIKLPATHQTRPLLVGKGKAFPVLPYCCIHRRNYSNRAYLRCCPITGAWIQLRCLEGVREWWRLWSVTLTDFSR